MTLSVRSHASDAQVQHKSPSRKFSWHEPKLEEGQKEHQGISQERERGARLSWHEKIAWKRTFCPPLEWQMEMGWREDY